LSICKDLIEQMGGSVRVESKEGVGSKFIVTLKCKTKADQFMIKRHISNSNSSMLQSFAS
jgi:K+-sensing histidine kinase KdpD